MLSLYAAKAFTALIALRYGSFVGSSCTPAVCLVPLIKIIQRIHRLQCGKGVSPIE